MVSAYTCDELLPDPGRLRKSVVRPNRIVVSPLAPRGCVFRPSDLYFLSRPVKHARRSPGPDQSHHCDRHIKKKTSTLRDVNPVFLPSPRSRVACVLPGRAVEVDEMWSFVGAKEKAQWLWHALDHHTGSVLAYVVGPRKDAMFLKLKALLAPFGITRYYTDKAGV